MQSTEGIHNDELPLLLSLSNVSLSHDLKEFVISEFITMETSMMTYYLVIYSFLSHLSVLCDLLSEINFYLDLHNLRVIIGNDFLKQLDINQYFLKRNYHHGPIT